MFSDCLLFFGLRCSPLCCVFRHFVSFRNSRRVAPLHSGKRCSTGNTLSVICPITSQSFVQSVAVVPDQSSCKDEAKMQLKSSIKTLCGVSPHFRVRIRTKLSVRGQTSLGAFVCFFFYRRSTVVGYLALCNPWVPRYATALKGLFIACPLFVFVHERRR